MDKILNGILLSTHPNPIKIQVIRQISNTLISQSNKQLCYPVLDFCFKTLHPKNDQSDSNTIHPEIHEALLKLVKNWIEKNKDAYSIYIIKSFSTVTFEDLQENDAVHYLMLLNQCLALYKEFYDIKTLQCKLELKEYLINVFLKIKDFHVLVEFCKLYLQYSLLIPINVDHEIKLEFVRCIIEIISKHPFRFFLQQKNNKEKKDNGEGSSSNKHAKLNNDTDNLCSKENICEEDNLCDKEEVKSKNDSSKKDTLYQDLDTIYELFSKYTSYDISIMKYIAGIIFRLMSSSSQKPSINMARFLPCLRLDVINESLEEMMSLKNIDETLHNCLLNLVDFNCFPNESLGINEWVIQFMKCLIKYRKFVILFNVIEVKVKQVCNLVYCTSTRKSSVSILTFMLISYLHSPLPFHQICTTLPMLIQSLKKSQPTNESEQIIQVLVELIYTQMYHFPGYPDIYGKLLDCVQGYVRPSEDNMKIWLKASFSLPQVSVPSAIIKTKSETGKIGLENLGNTCYANSVIQALYNSKSFRDEMLVKTFASSVQPISTSLQQLFALLYLSDRAAIAPDEFLTLSRPQWFQKGTQQDCSEYLKYLFDMLEQEDKKMNPSITNTSVSYFNGVMKTCIECSSCSTISCRDEIFNDLPLSFNENEFQSCTLKGGDSSEQIQRKMSLTNDPNLHKESSVMTETSNDNAEHSVTITINEKPKNIIDLMNSYFYPEHLKDSNQYFCDRCQVLQDAIKLHEIITFPKYLVLTLKRFTYDSSTQQRNKLLQVLSYPYEYFICNNCGMTNNEMRTKTLISSITCHCQDVVCYRISSVIVHSGISSESGHYYSYICEPNKPGGYGGNSWYLMNDSRITQSNDHCLLKLSETFPRDSPYICIYEKVGNNDLNSSMATSTETSSMDTSPENNIDKGEKLKLSQSLMDFVAKDNEKYLQEELRKQAPKNDQFRFNRQFNNDDDNNGGGSGGSNCSTQNSFNDWNSGRFIF